MFGIHRANLACSFQLNGSDIFSDITILELDPIAMVFEVWGSRLSGKRLIIIHIGNVTLESILISKTSRSKRVM